MSAVEAGERKRVKQLEVMVADVITETHDTTTIVLFTGNDKLDYRPGHFLTIDPHEFPELERFTAYLEDQKGKKEPPRAYSLASAPHEKYLSITVKEERYVSKATEFPPLLSPLLVRRMSRGSRMVVTGFTGPYTLPDDIENRTHQLVHVCAGSGVVPNMSMLKHALAHHPKLRHTLVLANKTWADVIYRRDLRELSAKHPDKLEVIHCLTREERLEDGGEKALSGRVSVATLRPLIREPSAVEVFVCGPGVTKWDKKKAKAAGEEPAPRFLESVLAALEQVGVHDDKVHSESYG